MEHEVDDYAGPATLLVDGTEIAVTVQLRGYFQPIDGCFHWYGRVAANEELSALVGAKKQVTVRTTDGSAEGQLTEPDPWQRYRISGRSTPPFRAPTAEATAAHPAATG